MSEIKVGDFIRSYDFKPMKGRPDSYVEGEVLELSNEVGYAAYKIRVDVDFFDGKKEQDRIGEIVFAPVKVAIFEYEGRIMNLSRI